MKKRYIVIFKDVADTEVVKSIGGVVVDELTAIPDLLIADLTEEEKNEIEKNDLVEEVEKDGCYDDPVEVVEASLAYGEPHAVELTMAKEFWNRGYKGQGVKVAIMDTGAVDHKGLNIAGGINTHGSISYLNDEDGHGTHVAGIVAGQPIKGGYVGIAPEVELYIIKADDNRGGGMYLAAQISGMNWAIRNGMDIVNCSFGANYPNGNQNSSRTRAFEKAIDAGIMIVASAGNGGNNDMEANDTLHHYPSGIRGVIVIANIKRDSTKAFSSSTGDQLDFSCYGSSYIATTKDGGYGYKTGTSMASPCFVGMMALYMCAFPELNTTEKLINKVKQNVIKLWVDSRDWTRAYGYGLPGIPRELYLRPVKSKTNRLSAKRNGWQDIPAITGIQIIK